MWLDNYRDTNQVKVTAEQTTNSWESLDYSKTDHKLSAISSWYYRENLITDWCLRSPLWEDLDDEWRSRTYFCSLFPVISFSQKMVLVEKNMERHIFGTEALNILRNFRNATLSFISSKGKCNILFLCFNYVLINGRLQAIHLFLLHKWPVWCYKVKCKSIINNSFETENLAILIMGTNNKSLNKQISSKADLPTKVGVIAYTWWHEWSCSWFSI